MNSNVKNSIFILHKLHYTPALFCRLDDRKNTRLESVRNRNWPSGMYSVGSISQTLRNKLLAQLTPWPLRATGILFFLTLSPLSHMFVSKKFNKENDHQLKNFLIKEILHVNTIENMWRTVSLLMLEWTGFILSASHSHFRSDIKSFMNYSRWSEVANILTNEN